MKITAYTNNPFALKNAIDKKIRDKELKTWEILQNNQNEVLYGHTPEQWKEKAMPKPEISKDKVEFEIRWWNDDEPNEETKGYISGRFVEILMVHFRDKFTNLKVE